MGLVWGMRELALDLYSVSWPRRAGKPCLSHRAPRVYLILISAISIYIYIYIQKTMFEKFYNSQLSSKNSEFCLGQHPRTAQPLYRRHSLCHIPSIPAQEDSAHSCASWSLKIMGFRSTNLEKYASTPAILEGNFQWGPMKKLNLINL